MSAVETPPPYLCHTALPPATIPPSLGTMSFSSTFSLNQMPAPIPTTNTNTMMINTTTATATTPAITDPRERTSLVTEYQALQPSASLRSAAKRELKVADSATVYAKRLALARGGGNGGNGDGGVMGLDGETPSEKRVFDDAFRMLALRAAAPLPAARRADALDKRRFDILAALYPVHPRLDAALAALMRERRHVVLLRSSLRDQRKAVAQLTDGANLLLLIADHVDVLSACYGPGTSSSSASCCSSGSFASERAASDEDEDEDGTRVGCLGRASGEEGRRSIYVSSVPSSYRIGYLRKCWGYAAAALQGAVEESTFLYREVERLGQRELVPGLEAQCKRCMWLLELPGGLTVFFRTDSLKKMASDARAMRDEVLLWQGRVRGFATKVRKEVGKGKKKVRGLEERLLGLREQLVEEEFRDVLCA